MNDKPQFVFNLYEDEGKWYLAYGQLSMVEVNEKELPRLRKMCEKLNEGELP